jgi:hypothetical protein
MRGTVDPAADNSPAWFDARLHDIANDNRQLERAYEGF